MLSKLDILDMSKVGIQEKDKVSAEIGGQCGEVLNLNEASDKDMPTQEKNKPDGN